MNTNEEEKPLKIYLDDERKTPDGFRRTYTVSETIQLLMINNGKVHTLSLDNDLGIGVREGREVMKWIEEQAYFNTLKPIPYLIIHTDNPVAENDMMASRYNAWKYWNGHGYKKQDFI